MSLGSSNVVGGGVGDFAKFAENRDRHDLEAAEIQEVYESLAPRSGEFEELVNKMMVASYRLTPEEDIFFKERKVILVELETRIKAEEARWAKECGEYTASKQASGTSPLTHFSTSEGSTWRSEDGRLSPLSGASQSKINEHKHLSALARRWMCAYNIGLWVGPNLELKVDEMMSALLEGTERIRVDTMLVGGAGYQLQLGSSQQVGSSAAIRVRLSRTPVYKDKKKFEMAVGAKAWRPNKLNLMDFGEAESAKDCERMTVIRSAALSFGEFFCWAFGDEHRTEGVVEGVLEVVNSLHVEEATQSAKLFIPFMLTQALSELFNLMRSTVFTEVGGQRVYVQLGDGKYKPHWKKIIERLFDIKPYTIPRFKEEFEKDFRGQLEAGFAKTGQKRSASSDAASDSGSEVKQPSRKQKKAAQAARAAASSTSAPQAQKARSGAGAAAASGAAASPTLVCWGAMAVKASYTDVPTLSCRRPLGNCRFSHDFSPYSLANIKALINSSTLPSMQGGTVKADFCAAAESSGQF